VTDFNTFDGDGVGVAIGVRDNDSGMIKHIGKFNTIVVAEEGKIDAGKESIIAVNSNVVFVNGIHVA